MSTSAPHCAVVGRGRLGTALTAALRAGGVVVEGPLGRGETPTEAFSLHPLMTVPHGAGPAALHGAAAAVAGSTPRALAAAHALARAAGMRPIEVADPDRVAYHVAASLADGTRALAGARTGEAVAA